MTSVSDKPVAGQILAGKYRIDRVIGEGAMGFVLGAFHLELEEPVAIKWVRDLHAVGPHAIERFLREAKLCARLQSEHVVRVRDVARTETGAPFIVMELLDGHDLAELVEGGKSVTPPLAVDYVIEACEAIAEAHQLGIVHRDLKLQNLFLARRKDGSDLVKVLDFGISKVTTSASLSMTTGTAILGSPLYMSPEQWRSSKDVDARSDIWSLGVVLFELLTGNVPFMAESLPELCMNVVTAPAPAPSSLTAGIPAELDRVVLACLEKDPAHRPPNVGAFVRALAPLATDRSRSSRERVQRLQPNGELPPRPQGPPSSNAALPVPPSSNAAFPAAPSSNARPMPIQTRTLVQEPSVRMVPVAAPNASGATSNATGATPSPAAFGPPGSASTSPNWAATGPGAMPPSKSKRGIVIGGVAVLGLIGIGSFGTLKAIEDHAPHTPVATSDPSAASETPHVSTGSAPVATDTTPEATTTARADEASAIREEAVQDAGAPVQAAKANATTTNAPATNAPTAAPARPKTSPNRPTTVAANPAEPAAAAPPPAVRDLGGSRR